MKLIIENWRKYVSEADTQSAENLGVYVKSEPGWWVELTLIDLNTIKHSLEASANAEEFLQKLEDKDILDSATKGFIKAQNNKELAKTSPTMGGSGGLCYNSWSVKESIGRGYGKQLYNALLGWAADNNIYITSDKVSVSPGAVKRWTKVDQQTDDEIPPDKAPYIGKFDNWRDRKTEPRNDDCVVHGDDALDKGYKDETTIDYYKELRDKLDNFFRDQVQAMFEEPGFWGKLFGNTPENRAEKIKNRLLATGQQKFHDYMLGKEQNNT